jgi:disulfide bond formation protein DsbB
MQFALTDLRRQSASRIIGLVLAVAAMVILAAHAFEVIGGYNPCPLCLQQRYAYYAAIPGLGIALYLLHIGFKPLALGMLLAVSVAFLANAGLGAYQAGAEWKFWDPPQSCAAPATLPTLQLDGKGLGRVPVSCGVASWRFFGLSFAGWNTVASLALAAGAAAAAASTRHAAWPGGGMQR